MQKLTQCYKTLMAATLLSLSAGIAQAADMMHDCKGKTASDCQHQTDSMKSDSMHKDGMMHSDTMKKDDMMKHDNMKSDNMKNGDMHKGGM